MFGKRNMTFRNKRIGAPVSFLRPALPLTEPRGFALPVEVGARPAEVSLVGI